MSGTAFRAPRPHLKRTERSLHPAPSLKGAPRLLGRPLVVRGVAPAPLQVGLKGAPDSKLDSKRKRHPPLQVGLGEEETPPTPSWTQGRRPKEEEAGGGGGGRTGARRKLCLTWWLSCQFPLCLAFGRRP